MPVFLGGNTIVLIGNLSYVATGGIALRSDAVIQAHLSREFYGGLVIGETGTSAVEGRFYDPSGGLLLSSATTVIQKDFGFVPVGGLRTSGISDAGVPSYIAAAFGGLRTNGTTTVTRPFVGGGAIRVLGSARIVSGFQSYTSHGNLLIGGSSLTIRGFHVFTASGLINFSGAGRLKYGYNYPYSPVGNLSIAGAAAIVRGFNTLTASGSLSLRGTPLTRFGLRYPTEMYGGFSVGGEAFQRLQTLVITLRSEWRVRGEITSRETFNWNNRGAMIDGRSVLYWFRVTSECVPVGCDGMGVQFQDYNCATQENGEGQLVQYQQTLTATDVADLCYRLKQTFLAYPLKWKVRKIEKFLRPVYSDGNVEYQCQILEEEKSFCSIPECMELCLMGLGEAEVPMGIQTTLIPVNRFVAHIEDPLYLISKTTAVIPPNRPVVGGKIAVGGTAEFSSDSAAMVTTFGVILSSQSLIVSSVWSHVASGHIHATAAGRFVSSAWRKVGQASVNLRGTAEVNQIDRRLVAVGRISQHGKAESVIQTANFRFETAGILNVGSEATRLSSAWATSGTGGVQLGINNIVYSSSWQKTSGGAISLRSNYQCGRRYSVAGGVSTSGKAIAGMGYRATGTVILAGESGKVGSNFTKTTNGTIRVSGAAIKKSNNLGFFECKLGGEAFIDYHQLIYRESIYDPLEWSTNELDVATLCKCSPIPPTLYLAGTFDKFSRFTDFLRRNKFALPYAIPIKFSSKSAKWERNYHFHGMGTTEGYEKWVVRCEWFCGTNFEGGFSGESLWQLMIMLRRSTSTRSDVSKILVNVMDSSAVCRANTLEITWNYSPKTHLFSINKNLTINGNIVDEIGIFSGDYWRNRQLKATLSDVVPKPLTPTMSLEQFLPAKKTTIFGRT